MFYAIWRNESTGYVRGFITDETHISLYPDDDQELDPVPLASETEEEMHTQLEGHPLYEAGWVEIVEL